MHDGEAGEGEVLLDVNEKGSARFLAIYGVVLAAIGIVVAVLGYYWGLIAVAPLPVLVWLSLRTASKRLVFTTKGVRFVRRRGVPALDDFAAWPTLRKVDFVSESERFSDGETNYYHFLVFDHGGAEPLRYRFGSRPDDELLKNVARICREHDVKVGF